MLVARRQDRSGCIPTHWGRAARLRPPPGVGPDTQTGRLGGAISWHLMGVSRSANSVRRACAALLIVLGTMAVVTTGSRASTGQRSPKAILHALLTSSIKADEIPHGLSKPRPSGFANTRHTSEHHALGGVQIFFAGGAYASIIYVVFPSRADAVADFETIPGGPGDVQSPAPFFLPKPSKRIDSASVGVTGVEYVDGNVLVLADAQSQAAGHGDSATAIALARLAATHLAATRAG